MFTCNPAHTQGVAGTDPGGPGGGVYPHDGLSPGIGVPWCQPGPQDASHTSQLTLTTRGPGRVRVRVRVRVRGRVRVEVSVKVRAMFRVRAKVLVMVTVRV